MENSMVIPQKVKITLPYNLAIPLLLFAIPLLDIKAGVKAGSQRNTCTPMFMAALLTVAKRSKQPKCASANERTDKTWCPNTTEEQKERNSDTCYSRDEA